jgi:3'-phosphoadenosine 5'-phosphosulfate sulfotransferase (PAPS reductase)/FAD synthetase
MEARFGKLWEQGIDGINRYNRLRKVEPMQRALSELGSTWIAGLRRSQSAAAQHRLMELRDGRWKLHPIADWDDLDVAAYACSDLPEHPLSAGLCLGGRWHTPPHRCAMAAWRRPASRPDPRYGLHFNTGQRAG